MRLLYANDIPGQHAPSWYAATSTADLRTPLQGNAEADVCVIGAGFTGLSAALELARRGKQVIVLEAHRVGWGASGRNGGQLGSGFNKDQIELEKTLGPSHARALWDIAESGKRWIHALCKEQALDIEYRPGIIQALHRKRFVRHLHAYCDFMHSRYNYTDLQPLDANEIRERVQSDAYFGGALDRGAGHVHSLKLARGIAETAENLNVRIHELTEATRWVKRADRQGYKVISAAGSVQCRELIIATNGYQDSLDTCIQARLMPINNFILVTQSLGERAEHLLPFCDAVADSRFVVNYFRIVAENRLLFGGGESYSYRFPNPIGPPVRSAMLKVFPQLRDVEIDYAWGGTLAITRNRLPLVAELSPSVYCAAGYSGHGLALSCACGAAIAKKITGDTENFTALAGIPAARFPGGVRFRPLLLASAMTFYSWIDHL